MIRVQRHHQLQLVQVHKIDGARFQVLSSCFQMLVIGRRHHIIVHTQGVHTTDKQTLPTDGIMQVFITGLFTYAFNLDKDILIDCSARRKT